MGDSHNGYLIIGKPIGKIDFEKLPLYSKCEPEDDVSEFYFFNGDGIITKNGIDPEWQLGKPSGYYTQDIFGFYVAEAKMTTAVFLTNFLAITKLWAKWFDGELPEVYVFNITR